MSKILSLESLNIPMRMFLPMHWNLYQKLSATIQVSLDSGVGALDAEVWEADWAIGET